MLSEQAQLGPDRMETDRLSPDRLKKPRAGSNEDRSVKLDRWGTDRPLGPIFLVIGIILGVNISSSFMSIEAHVSTSISPFEDLYKECSLSTLYVQSLFDNRSLVVSFSLCISILYVYLIVVCYLVLVDCVFNSQASA